MILTITPNSALDLIFFLDELRPGTTMRPEKMIAGVGGKGFDVSVALQALGIENLALGFVAGLTGQQLVKLLDDYSIRHDLTWVEGETRTSNVLIESKHRRHSHIIVDSLFVPDLAYQHFLERYRTHLGTATWVVAGGTLAAGTPVDAYRRIIELAQEIHIPVLIDSAGPPVWAALPARPTILKMNHHEFAETFGTTAPTLTELKDQAQAVWEREQLAALVLTAGAEGILAFTPRGIYLARSPAQLVVNAAGAGDATSAALVWRLSVGDSWSESLRWAAATGAAVVLTEQTGYCNLADVQRILKQTEVQNLPD